jgi:Nucleotidyl transferase
MDYAPFVQKHRETGADITVAALPMDAARAEAFGVMKVRLLRPQKCRVSGVQPLAAHPGGRQRPSTQQGC